jgi:hypothetical protein
MANNPNPKHIAREAEQLRKAEQNLRDALMDLEKQFLLVNSNFHSNGALMVANDAIYEANKQTKRLRRRQRLQALRRLPVGHPNRHHWYEFGDGRPDALELWDNKSVLGVKGHLGKYTLSLSCAPRKRNFTYC